MSFSQQKVQSGNSLYVVFMIKVSDCLPEFLITGTTEEDFQRAGNQKAARHLLYGLERIRARSETHFFRNIAGIPHDLLGI